MALIHTTKDGLSRIYTDLRSKRNFCCGVGLITDATSRQTALLAQLRETLGPQLDRRRFRLLTEAYGLGIRRTPYLHYRIADLSVFSLDKLERDKGKRDPDDPYIWTPPDLLAERLSPSNRKGAVEELLSDYESIQVSEAWFFYPEQPVLVMHECQNGRLREARRVERGIVFWGSVAWR